MYPSAKSILEHLRSLANPENVAGMARFGINPEKTYGISIPELRRIARQVGKDHELAQDLWDSGIHEARILACFIDEPAKVTEAQMDRWAADFDSWDVCDQCCGNLFDRTPFAYQKALEWSEYEQEFVKRAAFALMAYLAVHDKKAPDSPFEAFLPIIVRESSDDRNYVKKAVNWALRQIGKRSRYLNERAIEIAEEIKRTDSRAARWIASDALRELTSDKVQAKILDRR
jgi:3-methyladenine DNA glycosylase AlkD